MDTGVLLVIGVGLVGGGFLVWFLLFGSSAPVRAKYCPDGHQEADVLIRGSFQPQALVAKRGVPLRINFHRQEDTPCSERVIFSDFIGSARLPAFHTTTVNFIPNKCGEFLFTCSLGMYQGKLLVEEPMRSTAPKPVRTLRRGH